jgi:ribonuclease-3
MNDADSLSIARGALRSRLEALAGRGEIPRFEEALTHASFANESGARDNQRLEFLGDSVLGLCVSEMLIAAHPAADEGKLTRMRSALVNAEALAAWARRIELGACVALGRGARHGSERDQTNVLADATEALVAAVYEAFGLPGARALVQSVVGDGIERAEALATPDPKSALQELVQAGAHPAPTYRLVQIHGTASDQTFEVEVVLEGEVIASGQGRTKRLAERAAASAALEKLAREASPMSAPA